MLRRRWEAWQAFAGALGSYQSRLLLTLFYFVVVTPFGVLARAFGDPLRLRRVGGSSYWVARDDTGADKLDRARNQF